MKFIKSGDKLTEGKLAQFESEVGWAFPSDYKEFMLNNNGGAPEDCLVFSFEDIVSGKENNSDLREFFTVFDENCSNYTSYLDIVRIYKSMTGEEIIPPFFLPIGDDSGGNPICLNLAEEEYGAVFFCDHELENQDTGFLASSKIADSFTEFMSMLKPFVYNG
ncbi:MAG: SMI1/KNR4 family protein [Lachnospiraceae bacterium]|nr:SMI1/KNR4 family protein [Lachnospiraceae bacterium]